jgi:hypothetical protein
MVTALSGAASATRPRLLQSSGAVSGYAASTTESGVVRLLASHD